ncbi:MAG: mechanosensitive ion channel family protein [Endomicrobium sp.]|nr:mechanosensitive ion channel family protein [Endomicrobium sp.]
MLLNFLNQFVSRDFALWIKSVFLFIIILSLGLLVNKYVIEFIKEILKKFKVVIYDEIFIISKRCLYFWFLLLALYLAFVISPINTKNIIFLKVFYVLFSFSIVLLVTYIVSSFLKKSVHEKIGVNIIKFITIFIGFVLILNQVGVKLTPILTALGIGSLAVALALQDTLANFFAGINILASKQISNNDYIKLDSGQEGTILEVNWRTTLVRELSNTVISIPNSKISSSIVTSFHFQKAEVTVRVDGSVAYGSDLEHVEQVVKSVTLDVINKSQNAVKPYLPSVFFTSFGDSAINFSVYFRVKDVYSRSSLQSGVLKAIYKRFNEEKIEIPFPQRVVTINK